MYHEGLQFHVYCYHSRLIYVHYVNLEDNKFESECICCGKCHHGLGARPMNSTCESMSVGCVHLVPWYKEATRNPRCSAIQKAQLTKVLSFTMVHGTVLHLSLRQKVFLTTLATDHNCKSAVKSLTNCTSKGQLHHFFERGGERAAVEGSTSLTCTTEFDSI